MIKVAGELIDYVRECVLNHSANPRTEVFVRQGSDGPLQQITDVKMMKDDRGRAIILETSVIISS